MKVRIIFLVGAICLVLLALTACVPEDIDFMQAMADEWARAKKVHPFKEDGSPDPEGAANLIQAGLGISGDPETDAVVQAGRVVKSIKETDELADKALANQDANAAREAIKSRPDDYHYQVVLSVIHISNGNFVSAGQADSNALETAFKQNPNRDRTQVTAALWRNRLNTIEQALGSQTLSADGKARLGNQYCTEARLYRTGNGDPYYLERARAALRLDCR